MNLDLRGSSIGFSIRFSLMKEKRKIMEGPFVVMGIKEKYIK